MALLQPRSLGVALVAAAVAVSGCGSSNTSSSASKSGSAPANAEKSLVVFGAGTLAHPFAQEIAAFKAQHPGITVHSQFSASGDRVKAITQLGEPADVLGVADYSLIPKDMFGAGGAKRYANWYVGFVNNQITFAYTSHSKGAGQLTPTNWYQILAHPGVHIGRSNPSADPSGYQILQMLKLAEHYYRDPSLSAAILKNSPASSVAETETSLIAALQSGQLDYLAIYRSDALQHHFKFLDLPPAINLSDPRFSSSYAEGVARTRNGELAGKPIVYAVTITTNAEHRDWAEKYVALLLGPEGQAVMQKNGFGRVDRAYAVNREKMPAALQALAEPWPGS